LIFGCTDNIQNPAKPEKDIIENWLTLQKKEYSTAIESNELLSDSNLSVINGLSSDLRNFEEEADVSSSGTQSSGTIYLHYFNGIDDITEPGGYPSMEFAAWSLATNWYGTPVYIEKISVKAIVRWRFTDSPKWGHLWEQEDAKEDAWQAKVGPQAFTKERPWTAQSRSEHKYWMYPAQGGQKGEVYTYPISHTAYFVGKGPSK